MGSGNNGIPDSPAPSPPDVDVSPMPVASQTLRAPSTIAHPPRIALVAGEASGDQLGAGLIAELKRRHPEAQFVGIGGPGMRAAGQDAWHDCSELAVMGYAEVARHLPRLLRLRAALRKRLLAWRPDVFIGIDAPDFNLGLERHLKQNGVRTVHYVSPSIWAWKEKRAATMGRSADRVLCLFPMEPAIYAKYGMRADFVGHPLASTLTPDADRDGTRRALALPAHGALVAVMPGSRLSEIKRLGPDFLRACARLLVARPGLHFIAPMANANCRALFTQQLDRIAAEPGMGALRAALHLVDGRAHETLIACDVALLASGTAALEAMLAGRPMVVAYRIARATQAIVRGMRLLKTEHFSLPNVLHMTLPLTPDVQHAKASLAGKALVPELMQDACKPQLLADAVLAWLDDPARTLAVLARFADLHQQLRRDGAKQAADVVDDLLGDRR